MMAGKNRHRHNGRTTEKTPRPSRAGGPEGDPDELFSDIRGALATGEPLDLLSQVSALLAALDPRSLPPFERDRGTGLPTTEGIVGAFAAVERVETSALLTALSELAPSELLRARARRALVARDHSLPAWLTQLGETRVGRTSAVRDALGDGENVIVELLAPEGNRFCLIVYIDHNLGTVAKDGFAVPGPLEELVIRMKNLEETPGDAVWGELDPADARARLAEAIETGTTMFPPLESDSWPASRPLVEWALRLLPDGGQGYTRPAWDDDALGDLTERFFASPEGIHLDDPDHRDLLGEVLRFGTDYGPGDPMRWSPIAVEIILSDWIPRKIIAPADFLAEAPELLRALVSFCHSERAVRPDLTTETLAMIDRLEAGYQHTISSPRPQGTEALLGALGLLDDPSEPSSGTLAGLFDLLPDYGEQLADMLSREVGGEDALAQLDAEPLPDEPLSEAGIDEDIRARVAEISGLCDRCCEELLDVEYRSACRRFLARVAALRPELFRRRSDPAVTAAAVCWVIGHANELFSGPGSIRVKDLASHFGLAPSRIPPRGRKLLAAAGVLSDPDDNPPGGITLADPGLLTSAHRRQIIARRDHLTARG